MKTSRQFFQTASASLSLLSLLALPNHTLASDCSASSDPALTGLSLEQLMQIEITSLGGKPESFSQAAAVFVVTNHDIRCLRGRHGEPMMITPPPVSNVKYSYAAALAHEAVFGPSG